MTSRHQTSICFFGHAKAFRHQAICAWMDGCVYAFLSESVCVQTEQLMSQGYFIDRS